MCFGVISKGIAGTQKEKKADGRFWLMSPVTKSYGGSAKIKQEPGAGEVTP